MRDLLETGALLADTRCLVLLGEPGVGKTTELEYLRARVPSVVHFALGSYGSAEDVRRFVFRSDVVAQTIAASDALVLMLDGLDECRTHIEEIGAIVADELGRLPRDRLSVVLACRTAVWNSGFKACARDLPKLFDGNVRQVELQPLRREDVVEIASWHGVDGHQFLAEAMERGLGALLARPLTLNALADGYADTGKLAESRVAAYEQAIKRLLSESNAARLDRADRNALRPDQRLDLVRRLAFVLTFSESQAIAEMTAAGGGAHSILDIVAALRPQYGERANEAVLDALGTALFVADGPGRSAFSHQSYRDFLAAEFTILTLEPGEARRLLLGKADRVPTSLHARRGVGRDDRARTLCARAAGRNRRAPTRRPRDAQ